MIIPIGDAIKSVTMLLINYKQLRHYRTYYYSLTLTIACHSIQFRSTNYVCQSDALVLKPVEPTSDPCRLATPNTFPTAPSSTAHFENHWSSYNKNVTKLISLNKIIQVPTLIVPTYSPDGIQVLNVELEFFVQLHRVHHVIYLYST